MEALPTTVSVPGTEERSLAVSRWLSHVFDQQAMDRTTSPSWVPRPKAHR